MQYSIYKTLKKYSFILAALSIGLVACNDIFEDDLGSLKVYLLAPGNYLASQQFTNTFFWEDVPGALTYNLQIVEPGFSQISNLLLDTTITDYKYSFTLTPGTYQWRVKAINGSSETSYT